MILLTTVDSFRMASGIEKRRGCSGKNNILRPSESVTPLPSDGSSHARLFIGPLARRSNTKRRQTHELLAPPVTLLHRGRRGCRGRGGREAKGEVLLAIFCHGGIASSINTPLNSIRPFAKNWVYGGNNWLLTLRIGTTVCKNVETPIPSGLRGRLTIVVCEHICVYMWEGFSGFIGLRFACFLFGKSCVGLSEKGLVKWQIFAPKMKFYMSSS